MTRCKNCKYLSETFVMHNIHGHNEKGICLMNFTGACPYEKCEYCKYLTKLYVPPIDVYKNIPKDAFVCTLFLKEANQVQYLDTKDGMCEMFTEKINE